MGINVDLGDLVFIDPVGTGFSRAKDEDTSDRLRIAFAANPHMRVLVAQGRYDRATPFDAIDYTLNHTELDPSVRGNITTKYHEAGHMLYTGMAGPAGHASGEVTTAGPRPQPPR